MLYLPDMDLCQRIRLWRESANLTQSDLAALCGVTKSAVSQWESGRHSPSLVHLEQVVVACKTDISTFLRAIPKKRKP